MGGEVEVGLVASEVLDGLVSVILVKVTEAPQDAAVLRCS